MVYINNDDSMVGGNISTNAAGKYMIRNNGLRGYVVGLEVVLSDGKVLDMRGAVRKDNTGPDLK
jgi:FAD/FMN-containing dehydrogenase